MQAGSPASISSGSLATGAWYAHVAAVDGAGNWSAVATAGPFTIDVTRPIIRLKSVPRRATATTANRVAWVVVDTTKVKMTCALDTARRFARCVSGSSRGRLRVGLHTLRIRAIDADGNTSTITARWVVERG